MKKRFYFPVLGLLALLSVVFIACEKQAVEPEASSKKSKEVTDFSVKSGEGSSCSGLLDVIYSQSTMIQIDLSGVDNPTYVNPDPGSYTGDVTCYLDSFLETSTDTYEYMHAELDSNGAFLSLHMSEGLSQIQDDFLLFDDFNPDAPEEQAGLSGCVTKCDKDYTNDDGTKKKGRGWCKFNCYTEFAVDTYCRIRGCSE